MTKKKTSSKKIRRERHPMPKKTEEEDPQEERRRLLRPGAATSKSLIGIRISVSGASKSVKENLSNKVLLFLFASTLCFWQVSITTHQTGSFP